METKDYSWTSQSILNFEFHLGIVAPPFSQGHLMTSALILCIDKKAFKDFNAGR